ncbi:hypothetical protein G9A89_020845 [Geosiphon pyriformis]|nr:hypothetical protein G9A89_020845 [Geosiphon pyriformis]
MGNDTFSGVIHFISISKLLLVIGGLFDEKAAGLFGIPNEFNKLPVETGECVLEYEWCVCPVEKGIDFEKDSFDHILFVCSKFGVLQSDNFSVLRGTSTQSLVFAVGSVVKDALEKNREIWLIKIYDRFIKFFGSIHENRINKVMTNFGLSDGYRVYDELDQGKVFSPLLWRIFYDPLLCEIKRHEHLCEYWIDTKFVSKSEKIESCDGMTSYFAAGAIVDDMIWVGSCQTLTQYALNIASKFFEVNGISINNDKTPISIAKKGEVHHYLEIFLFIKGLFKPSVAKAHSDVCFFVNVVLKKTITDKQFSYLVLVVLQPIVSYQIQFSFVSSNVCHKWDVIIRKGLKLKACLSCDFPNVALHYSLLYGLKTFEQVQFESKLATVVFFSNALGILGHLFNYRFLDLQIMGWALFNLLQFPVRLRVSSVNNFLAGIVKIFLYNKLSLVNNLPNAFHSPGVFPMLMVLGNTFYFSSVHSLKYFGVVFGDRLLDKKGQTNQLHGLNILDSQEFFVVQSSLHEIWSSSFDVFTDDSLKNFGSANVFSGTAVYFSAVDLNLGIRVWGLLSFTLAELQAIALALECCSSFCMVVVHTDSQAIIDAYVSEMFTAVSNFRALCWVKKHSGVCGNEKANAAAGIAICSQFVCHAHWEAGAGHDIILSVLIGSVDWKATSKFSVAVKKKLYNKSYPDVQCLLCGEMKLLNHVFLCALDVGVWEEILAEASALWISLVEVNFLSSSAVLWFLGLCSSDIGLYSVVCKRFVMKDWCAEAVGVFNNKKEAVSVVVNYVRRFVKLHCSRIWLVRSKYRVDIERTGLVRDGKLVSGLTQCMVQIILDSIVRMLSIANFFTVSFGCHKSCLFFSELDCDSCVIIGV